MEHKLDATNQKLGRIASKAAHLLSGKSLVTFARNAMPTEKVSISNASKLNISEKSLKTKQYSKYSGYPGGLKKPTQEEISIKMGYKEILRMAISGMLPKNKLRARMLKNLKISE